MKRIIVAALAALLLLLCGCACADNAEKRLTEANEKLADLDSAHMQIQFVISTDEPSGYDVVMDMDVDMTGYSDPSALAEKGTVHLKLGMAGEAMRYDQNMQFCMWNDGGAMRVAFSLDGKTWYDANSALEGQGIPFFDNVSVFNLTVTPNGNVTEQWQDLFKPYLKLFHRSGRETVEGVKLTMYEATIEGETLNEILQKFQNMISFSDELANELPGIKVRIGIDSKGYPAYMEFDMGAFMQKFIEHMGETDVPGVEMRMTCIYLDFDAIDPIVPPDDSQITDLRSLMP